MHYNKEWRDYVMIKRNVKFTDFNGVEKEDILYFNLNEPELMRFQSGVKGGMDKFIEEVVANGDQGKIFNLFEEVVLMAYGEKSADGSRFVKNEEIKENFKNSAAYAKLFMELIQDPDEATKFINGVCNR